VARGEPSFKSEAIALSPSDESLHQPSKFGSVVSHKLVWLGIALVGTVLVSVGSWAWLSKHPITAKAQYELGVKYEKGDGVPQDDSKAAFWYHEAAERGEREGQFGLGAMYESGRGVPRDLHQAALWYQKAALQGDDDAKQRLDQLPVPQELTQDTISKVHEFEHGDWTKVLLVPQVSKTAARLFGTQLPYFREIGTGGAGVKDGLLIVDGCIPHDCPNGGILTIDVKTGATAGGLVDDSGVTVYTGEYTRDSLPAVLKQWLESNNNLSVRYKEAQIPVSAGSSTPDAREQELLSKSKDFDVCRVYTLTFQELRCSDIPLVEQTGSCEYSSRSSLKTLQLLQKAGFVVGVGTSAHSGDIVWAKLPKVKSALGTTIVEEKTGTTSTVTLEDYGNGFGLTAAAVPHQWKVITGCRELSGIDATTALADGEKVDFSWHWKPTELGIADGLSVERQRGVAYFTRSTNGLAIDRIQIDADKIQ
jgi:hypothetical protein